MYVRVCMYASSRLRMCACDSFNLRVDISVRAGAFVCKFGYGVNVCLYVSVFVCVDLYDCIVCACACSHRCACACACVCVYVCLYMCV